ARDEHLRSDDFFSAEKFPKMTFQNAVLKSNGEGKFELTGDLTIKDVTKKVTFNTVQNNGVIVDPWGQTRAGFTAKLSINRFVYSYTQGGVEVQAPEVEIICYVEHVKQ